MKKRRPRIVKVYPVLVCPMCARPFRPRSGNALLCHRVRCHRARQRESHAAWLAKNGDAFRAYNREWMQRKRTDPAYREREREQQRQYQRKEH